MSVGAPSNGSQLEMTEASGSTPVGDVENQINGVSEEGERSPLLAGEQENLAEFQIGSLRWIKTPGNEKYLEAYETWQAKDALFTSRVDRKRKQSNSLRNEIYQLIGFYLVFQGVLLTAVAQSNLLTCHNWWTAFCLSLLASVVTVGGVVQKFISSIDLEMTIASETNSRTVCIKRVNALLNKRERFSFQVDAKDPAETPASQTKHWWSTTSQTKHWWSAIVVTVILLIFSALFLASVHLILCDPGFLAPLPAPNGG